MTKSEYKLEEKDKIEDVHCNQEICEVYINRNI